MNGFVIVARRFPLENLNSLKTISGLSKTKIGVALYVTVQCILMKSKINPLTKRLEQETSQMKLFN
jgi:hypothetical protein